MAHPLNSNRIPAQLKQNPLNILRYELFKESLMVSCDAEPL